MAKFKYIGQFNGEGNLLTIKIPKKDGSVQVISDVITGVTEIEVEDSKSLRYLRADTNHFEEIL